MKIDSKMATENPLMRVRLVSAEVQQVDAAFVSNRQIGDLRKWCAAHWGTGTLITCGNGIFDYRMGVDP